MKKLHFAWFGSPGPNGWNLPGATVYDWREADLYQDVDRQLEGVLEGHPVAVVPDYFTHLPPEPTEEIVDARRANQEAGGRGVTRHEAATEGEEVGPDAGPDPATQVSG